MVGEIVYVLLAIFAVKNPSARLRILIRVALNPSAFKFQLSAFSP